MTKTTPRSCTPCTACCDGWLQLSVNNQQIGFANPCTHISDKGCGIYTDRPVDPCQNFMCAWVNKNSLLPDWMRPDLSKVILIHNKYIWNQLPVSALVSIEETINEDVLSWAAKHVLAAGDNIIAIQTFSTDQSPPKTKITLIGSDEYKKDIGNLLRSGKFSLNSKNLSL